jgi:hypothetical protein
MDDIRWRQSGIYHKFRVSRVDGSDSPGARHDSCAYFVLDCDHDPHAKAAIKAYADSCRSENPKLSIDLDNWWATLDFGRHTDSEPESR